jgi:superoxide dismutase, Cu-Zn family
MHKFFVSLAVVAATSLPAAAQTTPQTTPQTAPEAAPSDAPTGQAPSGEATPAEASAAETTEMVVNFTSVDGVELGTAQLSGTASGLLIRLELRDLPADGWVAFHIHEGSACDVDGQFESAGDHWNEGNTPHGYLSETGPHSGDMPNMHVRGDGRLLADVFNPQAFLSGETGNVTGRTLILHAGADDYASQPSGDAGDRLACAVIE